MCSPNRAAEAKVLFEQGQETVLREEERNSGCTEAHLCAAKAEQYLITGEWKIYKDVCMKGGFQKKKGTLEQNKKNTVVMKYDFIFI